MNRGGKLGYLGGVRFPSVFPCLCTRWHPRNTGKGGDWLLRISFEENRKSGPRGTARLRLERYRDEGENQITRLNQRSGGVESSIEKGEKLFEA